MNAKTKGALMVLLCGVLWSLTGLLAKLVSWSSLTLAGLRALPALVILGLVRKSFRIRPNKGLWISALGISMTSLLYMFAIRLTSSANAIVLQYTAPVFVILYMFLVKRQRPLKSEMVAAVFVFVGVCMCFAGSIGGGQIWGDLIALLSGVSYAVVFLASRYSGNDPLDCVYFGTLVTCPLALYAFFDPGFAFEPMQLTMVLALGVQFGLGYLFFSLGMRQGISPVTASIISNVEPVLNPVWVFLLLHEHPSVPGIIGAAVVMFAVTLQSVYEALRARRSALPQRGTP